MRSLTFCILINWRKNKMSKDVKATIIDYYPICYLLTLENMICDGKICIQDFNHLVFNWVFLKSSYWNAYGENGGQAGGCQKGTPIVQGKLLFCRSNVNISEMCIILGFRF